MRDRRGSAMYDAARDIFTKSGDDVAPESTENAVEDDDIDEAPQHSLSNNVENPEPPSDGASSPGSRKRKRTRSPEGATSAEPSVAESQPSKSTKLTPDPSSQQTEISRTAPSPAKEAAPKAMTAANLASMRPAKKKEVSRSEATSRSKEDARMKRRRSRSPLNGSPQNRRRDAPPPRRRTPSPKPISRSPTPPARSPPRQRRRPGATARVNAADSEAVRQRQLEREQKQNNQAQAEAVARGVHDVVRQHYNAVPQRGKDWRKTDSLIKGLRSLNNWVKSAVIQKFSPNPDYTPGATDRGHGRDGGDSRGLLVLDMGCGKGGDLQKWHAAPQKVDLYVGLDPAEVSISQAQERHSSMRKERGRNFRDRRELYHAELKVKDCYGEWIGDVPIVQEVGIDPSVGPDGLGPKRYGGGGFDVVTMMFCMHYAFESEAKARMMLRNVAGALKKGGRFIGVIPNSDVLSAKVLEYNASKGIKIPASATAEAEDAESDDDWDPEQTLDSKLKEGKEENSSSANEASQNGTSTTPPAASNSTSDQKPIGKTSPSTSDTKNTKESPNTTGADKKENNDKPTDASTDEALTWGNALYSVKFPSAANLPADGVFRPPFGWKYFYFLEEAVEEIPEYVVPWEAFRALALEYDLELDWRRPFPEVWDAEKDDPVLGPLSERMGVRARDGSGRVLVQEEEFDAAGFYVAFCFGKVGV